MKPTKMNAKHCRQRRRSCNFWSCFLDLVDDDDDDFEEDLLW